MKTQKTQTIKSGEELAKIIVPEKVYIEVLPQVKKNGKSMSTFKKRNKETHICKYKQTLAKKFKF